ncbi:MED6-domain-containing protein [Cylindrobasidium torrendii FP15055 ss-10]|uniref:Mediator of RNA polymerase II transcription subunit 6 n=1 Tax=Cylindrobasidium torrendii FP15055 ss-10 TaxID=1314674 RepID=A0A0D7BDE2_9AGAR|nr:MED6-domain-containing protein [Cylindrobasidium torrendii FP15055 ss-10]
MDSTADLHPPDDGGGRYFIWHEWIQANSPMTAENVFEYFACSQFYDKQSNNQVLRMQTMHTGVARENEAEELKRFVGIEFAVVHADTTANFFIIHKRERTSPEHTTPLAVYFIENNRVFQAPDIYTLVSMRLAASIQGLQKTLDSVRSRRPEYTPRTGYVWPVSMSDFAEPNDIAQSKPATLKDGAETQPNSRGASVEPGVRAPPRQGAPQRQQNNSLMLNAMRATALHSQLQNHVGSSAFTNMANVLRNAEGHDSQQANSQPKGQQTSSQQAESSRGPATPANPAPATPKPPTKEPGPPGGGKKKKKRTATMNSPPPPTTSTQP